MYRALKPAAAIACLAGLVSCTRTPPVEPAASPTSDPVHTGETSTDSGMLGEATTCDAAMQHLGQTTDAVLDTCATRQDCGLVELAYNACEGGVSVNITEQSAEARETAGAALVRARELCGYVHPPCPAPIVGEPVCVQSRCEATYQLLGRAPVVRLQVLEAAGPLLGADVDVTIRSGSPMGDEVRTVRSDGEGWVELPTTWLGAPQVSVSIGVGSTAKQFQTLADLLEAAGGPVLLVSP